MRTIFTICCLLFCNLANSQKKETFTIYGDIKGLEDNTIVYLFITGGEKLIKDSVRVMNNRFRFSGKVDDPYFSFLMNGKTSKLADILLDNRTIFLAGNAPDYDSTHVSGSDIDAQWKEYYEKDLRLSGLQHHLEAFHDSLLLHKDTAMANLLRNDIDKIIYGLRIPLLSEYVQTYKDSPAGAVLITFCLLENYLTKLEYYKLYNQLTLPIRNSSLGHRILRIAKEKN